MNVDLCPFFKTYFCGKNVIKNFGFPNNIRANEIIFKSFNIFNLMSPNNWENYFSRGLKTGPQSLESNTLSTWLWHSFMILVHSQSINRIYPTGYRT